MKFFEKFTHLDYNKQIDYLDTLKEMYNLHDCIYSADYELDDVAVDGTVMFVHTGYYERKFAVVLTSPTWFELWVQANKMIPVVNDFHHVFLEGIERNENGTYSFSMGS